MYQVNIGDKVLYYPSSKDYAIYSTELNEEIGLAGEFTFKVPPTNPLYDQLTQGALITILDNKVEIWRGEIKDIKIDFAKIADVYCVEDLGMLGYEFAPPESTKTETYAQRFQSAIAYYNANRPAELQFTAGYITNVTDSNLCNWTTEHEWSILDSIRACICRDTGYLRVRRVTTGGTVTRYIDVVRLEDYGRVNQQPIEFGYNLLDYVKESDYGNLVNVLTPYGAEVDTEVYEGYNERVQGDTITNAASVSVYGRHAKAVVFDNVTDVNSLNALASSYLTRYSQPQLKMEVKAVDLSQVENVDEIKIGDSLHIIAKPFAVDQWLYLTQIKRDLQNAGNNTITLSGYVRSGQTLTSQNAETIDAIKNIPSKSNILDAAKKNALNILLDETQGGHIVYEYHYTDGKPDYIEALNICDQPTIDASLSRWRWSYNGLGFLSRTSTTDPWNTATMPIALTNMGEINADRILTGTLDADQVTVHGKIEATSGYIGDAALGWDIGSNNIHNGVTGMDDSTHEGTYIGIDGIRFNQKPTDPTPNAYTKITKLGIDCQTTVSASGFYGKYSGSGFNGHYINVDDYQADGISGVTPDVFLVRAYHDGSEKWVGLMFKSGILIGTTNL